MTEESTSTIDMGSANDQIISNGLITNYGMIDTGNGDDKITV